MIRLIGLTVIRLHDKDSSMVYPYPSNRKIMFCLCLSMPMLIDKKCILAVIYVILIHV